MSQIVRCAVALAALSWCSPAVAEEPLWTEGAGAHAGLAAHAPVNLQSFVKLASRLGPAVVNVVAIQNADDARELFDRPGPNGQPPPGERPHGRGRGQGTGFIVHRSGYILTNAHVIENADDIRVRLVDERELTARLIGRDERTDIALLKIDAGAELPVAPLGNSDAVEIGEWVVAIGNPFGLDHTVTAGIISAKGRRDVRPGGLAGGFFDFLQTDASINPGNSGGPLINVRGEVIGINTAVNAQAQGIGFAIPINMVKVIAPLLKRYGRAPRSWLGVFPQPLAGTLRKAFGVGDGRGALLSEVVPASPAARAGLQAGDVVTTFDGHVIHRADDLTWLVATAQAGKPVTVVGSRAGHPFTLAVTPLAAPDEEKPSAPPPKVAANRKSPLGMTVSEISSEIARELGNPQLHGVVVMSVEPESPAVEAGIERGDLILRVGDLAVDALEDYARAVRAITRGDMIRILVRRENKNLWVAFQKR